MERASDSSPFTTSFQFRADEERGLEALFNRAFFDVPFSTEARSALSRTRFGAVSDSGDSESTDSDTSPQKPDAEVADDARSTDPTDPALESGAARLARGDPEDSAERARNVLLYRGAHGIGKTRIFRQFREHAQRKLIPCYEVYCHDVEGIPFKPFLHTIRQILSGHRQGELLQEKYRYALEGLIPELFPDQTETDPFGPITPERFESEKVRLFDGITQLLLEVTVQAPLLLLVHDLHRSDASTIELLRYIGRNLYLRSEPGNAASLVSATDPDLPPELEEEGDEWRGLAKGNLHDVDSLRDVLNATGQDAKNPVPPARLMIIANYRSSSGDLGRGGGAPGDTKSDESDESDKEVQQALRVLGEEPFAYHGELRVLQRQEADAFVRKAVEGVTVGGAPLQVDDDAIEVIYRASEGFPSFTQEFLRALYHATTSNGATQPVWRGEWVEQTLAVPRGSRAYALGPEEIPQEGGDSAGNSVGEDAGGPGDADSESSDSESSDSESSDSEHAPEGPGASTSKAAAATAETREQESAGDDTESGVSGATKVSTAPIEGPERLEILRLRLSELDPEETAILQTLAVARRPMSAQFVAMVLSDGDSNGDSNGASDDPGLRPGRDPAAVAQILLRLSQTGFLEQAEGVNGHGLTDEAETDARAAEAHAYFFRLWDYATVVEEGIPEARARELHQRIGVERQRQEDRVGGEGAYEVFYHLNRGTDPRAALNAGLAAARWFSRSLALSKSREIYNGLVELFAGEEDRKQRVCLLEKLAGIHFALKENETAAALIRKAQAEGDGVITPEHTVELLLLEAEATGRLDPAKGLKVAAKAAKNLPDENTRLGARLQLMTARLRLRRQDTKRAINLCLKGIGVCQKIGDIPEFGELYRAMANAFAAKGDYAHAVDNYQRAVALFEKYDQQELLVDALGELGGVYLERGNYFRSARYLYRALEIRRREQDVVGLCRSYDDLGRVYLRSGDYLKTIENLNRSLSLKERVGDLVGDFVGLSQTLSTLGDLYCRLGCYEEAIKSLRRAISNCQRLGDTPGLVDASAELGHVLFEIGEFKRAEGLARQVAILSGEFKLREQEAAGASLDGKLRALDRDWDGAEKKLRQASDIYARLGHRRKEGGALLNLAEVKLFRELYDDALKIASKGQIIAEELKATDLQVRALTIKGNVQRFLKGGNIDKARESFEKAVELDDNVGDVDILFNLFYSFAKLCHSTREFSEAASYYSKAELVLRQVTDGLSEDRRPRFQEDVRRKEFAEDLARFRKESLGRSSSTAVDLRESSATIRGLKDRPVGVGDYKDLLQRVLRVNGQLDQLHFYDHLLTEAMELAGADRGFFVRVQNRQYLPVAFRGFGDNAAQHPEYSSASQITQEAIRKGRSYLAEGTSRRESKGRGRQERVLQLGELAYRSILAVPLMTDERIFGGIYMDNPVSVGQFGSRDQLLVEGFAQHVAVAMNNRRQFEMAIREPATGFHTPSYFIDRLREVYRTFNLHGKVFSVIAYYLPNLDDLLGDGREHIATKLSSDLREVLPPRVAVCWGNPVLYALLGEADVPEADEIAERVRQRLAASFLDEIAYTVLPAHGRYRQGSDIYFEARKQLLPEECEQKALTELRAVLANDVTLRDAKRLVEKFKIEVTLRKTGGNITHAARELGIHRPQLSNLMKKYALKREVFEYGGKEEDGDGAE